MDEAEEQRKARDICYALLTARARSRQELHDALLRKGISAGAAEVVLGKFDRAGLIDDATYLKLLTKTVNQVLQTPGREVVVLALCYVGDPAAGRSRGRGGR